MGNWGESAIDCCQETLLQKDDEYYWPMMSQDHNQGSKKWHFISWACIKGSTQMWAEGEILLPKNQPLDISKWQNVLLSHSSLDWNWHNASSCVDFWSCYWYNYWVCTGRGFCLSVQYLWVWPQICCCCCHQHYGKYEYLWRVSLTERCETPTLCWSLASSQCNACICWFEPAWIRECNESSLQFSGVFYKINASNGQDYMAMATGTEWSLQWKNTAQTTPRCCYLMVVYLSNVISTPLSPDSNTKSSF